MMPLTLAIMGDAVSLKYRQVALSRILVFGISGQIAGGVVAGPIAAIPAGAACWWFAPSPLSSGLSP
jgi:hypothetical protein